MKARGTFVGAAEKHENFIQSIRSNRILILKVQSKPEKKFQQTLVEKC
jgi:hypothetical protein